VPLNLNLRTAFSSAFAVTIILLTVLLSYVIGNESTKSVEESTGVSLAESAYQMSESMDQFMWSRSSELEVLSKLNVFQEPIIHKEEVDGSLEQLKKSLPVFSWVGYIDTQGHVISSTDPVLLDENISDQPVFKEGMKGPFYGDVHDAGATGQFVAYSTPIYSKQGKLTGVLAAHLNWEWSREIEKSLLTPLQERLKGVEVFVISKEDNTVLLGPRGFEGKKMNSHALNIARSGNSSWILDLDGNKKSYLTGFSSSDGYLNYPGMGWTVIIRQPADEVVASVDQLEKFIVLGGMATAVLFGILGWFTAGWIVRPIHQITAAADLLSSGVEAEIPTTERFKDVAGLSSSLRILVSKLTQQETTFNYISDMARHDALTGLPNKLALDDFLSHAVSRARQNHTTLSMLYLDLDGFKKINETLGHTFGDRLLQEASVRLLECTRDNEIVARIGGDEFVVILHTSEVKAMYETEVVAKRIISTINEPFQIDGERIQVGCNIGAAVWTPESQDTSETLRLADEALYISKRSGKNRITFETAV